MRIIWSVLKSLLVLRHQQSPQQLGSTPYPDPQRDREPCPPPYFKSHRQTSFLFGTGNAFVFLTKQHVEWKLLFSNALRIPHLMRLKLALGPTQKLRLWLMVLETAVVPKSPSLRHCVSCGDCRSTRLSRALWCVKAWVSNGFGFLNFTLGWWEGG